MKKKILMLKKIYTRKNPILKKSTNIHESEKK